MKIFYFPLEPYKERYTVQLSSSKKGWLESRWVQNGIDYIRVEGTALNDDNQIKTGSVLDSNGRGYWACSQIMNFLSLFQQGKVSQDDVLYFDDFWHPGIEALPYTFHLSNVWPKMYAMLHAQSVDMFDFTYPMRGWMRHLERSIGSFLSGIFVTSTCLYDLCLYNGVGNKNNLFICGLPYNSDEVKTHFPSEFPKRKRQVIFSSRWDKEKRPDVFLAIAERVYQLDPTIQFVITTSATKLRSNEESALSLLEAYKFPNLTLKENQSKEQYYENLLSSSMQINTADQDFVSWTLLEATTCGCRPLYPYFLSFPEVLDFRGDLMYIKNDVEDAAQMIIKYIDGSEENWDWVYKKFDLAWFRMYKTMKGEAYDTLY